MVRLGQETLTHLLFQVPGALCGRAGVAEGEQLPHLPLHPLPSQQAVEEGEEGGEPQGLGLLLALVLGEDGLGEVGEGRAKQGRGNLVEAV